MLNLAHLAIVTSCLWAFVALAILFVDLMSAIFAILPDFHVSQADIVRWLDYAQRTNGKLDPEIDRRIADFDKRKDVIGAHFAHVRDGHAFVLIIGLTLLALLIFIATVAVGVYVFEGMKSRRINEGKAAHAVRDRLLASARAALPPGFPPIKLCIARETFLRYRITDGLTAFLHDALFVFLRNHVTEFRFVLTHELFHLRCVDSWFNVISKAFRRMLIVLIAVTVFFTTPVVTDRAFKGVLACVQLPLGALCAFIVARLVRRFDVPFLMHKELLADAFAANAYPDADLSSIYRNTSPLRTHPTAAQRLAFLRTGETNTAAKAFFAPQEMLAFCVLVLRVPLFREVVGPRLPEIVLPVGWIAFAGMLVLAIEALRVPIAEAERKPLVQRGGMALVACAIIAAVAPPFWFSVGQLALLTIVLVRVGALPIVIRAVTETKPPAESDLQVVKAIATKAFGGVRSAALLSAERRRTRIGLLISWIAVVGGVYMIANFVVGMTLRFFPADIPTSLPPVPYAQQAANIAMMIVVIAAAARNIKRPAIASLAIEWLAYAALVEGFILQGIWMVKMARGSKTSLQFFSAMARLPWTDSQKLKALGPLSANPGIIVTASLLPQLMLAAVYAMRVHGVITKKREERLNETDE